MCLRLLPLIHNVAEKKDNPTSTNVKNQRAEGAQLVPHKRSR